jgi:erythromycin esterase-like protein
MIGSHEHFNSFCMDSQLMTQPAFQLEAEQLLNNRVHPLNESNDLDPIMKKIGDARIVMLGEASHGTHEYYTWRSEITKRLIRLKGFNFIAVEGDWLDCYAINRYIKNYTDEKAFSVLKQFKRWPTWMWANWEVLALAEWLAQHNASLQSKHKIGFYGLDVYSLWESFEEIANYLKKVDPAALAVAQKAFQCFELYKEDEGQSYALATQLVPRTYEDEVVNTLKSSRQRMANYDHDYENSFSLEQNALIAVNAEKHYRAMMRGGAASWNVRDAHMHETLKRLLDFHGPHTRVIVWAHNTHIGDASQTDMRDDGMFNIGELARKDFPGKAVLIGFGSGKGSVVAGRNWGAPMQRMSMPQGREGSWEDLMHNTKFENKIVISSEIEHPLFLDNAIGHRAIGVVYNPHAEPLGNYVPSIIPRRYDAFIYLDETMALHPIALHPDEGETPDTYPFGV